MLINIARKIFAPLKHIAQPYIYNVTYAIHNKGIPEATLQIFTYDIPKPIRTSASWRELLDDVSLHSLYNPRRAEYARTSLVQVSLSRGSKPLKQRASTYSYFIRYGFREEGKIKSTDYVYLNTNNKLMEVQDAMRELKPLLPVYEGTKHRELIIIAYNRLA